MGSGPSATPTGLLLASPPAFSLLRVPGVQFVPSTTNGMLEDINGNLVPRWVNSVRVEPDNCQVPFLLSDASDGDWPYWWDCPAGTGVSAETALVSETAGVKLISTNNRANVVTDPVIIWAGYECSALDLGHSDVRRAEIEGRVRRKLEAILPAAVERELESGQIARQAGFANHYLRDITTRTELTADLGYVTALAELEQALAENGVAQGQRFIHAQPRLVTLWASENLIEVSPDRTHLLTRLGSYVVPGTGYRGAGPGTDPGATSSYSSTWAYATGPIRVLLDTPQPRELEINQASVTSRTINDVQLRLEQAVAIVWDPCLHFAIRTDLCDRTCGGGS